MKPYVITTADLKALHLWHGLEGFRRRYPKGAPVTMETFEKERKRRGGSGYSPLILVDAMTPATRRRLEDLAWRIDADGPDFCKRVVTIFDKRRMSKKYLARVKRWRAVERIKDLKKRRKAEREGF